MHQRTTIAVQWTGQPEMKDDIGHDNIEKLQHRTIILQQQNMFLSMGPQFWLATEKAIQLNILTVQTSVCTMYRCALYETY